MTTGTTNPSFNRLSRRVFALLLAVAASIMGTGPAVADWAYQDPDNTVHILSSTYTAVISGQSGAVAFYDPTGTWLLDGDFSVSTFQATYLQSTYATPAVSLNVNGPSTTVVVSQPGTDISCTTTYGFGQSDKRLSWQETLAYNTEQRVTQEKFVLGTPSFDCVDDDGSSDYTFGFIDGNMRQKKLFNLTSIPQSAYVSAFMGWRDDSGSNVFNSTLIMSINGHDYDISSQIGAIPKTQGGGPTTWISKTINPADLVVGSNQIVIRIANRVGAEYVYTGIDFSHDYDRSAFSLNNGATWNFNDLASPNGTQNGEYMVRLYTNHSYNQSDVTFWKGSSNSLAPNAIVSKYSPRLMRVPFTAASKKLTVYGSDYGAANIEELASGSNLEAYIYHDVNNGYDTVIDPRTAQPIDPVHYSEFQINDIVRKAGTTSTATLVLEFAADFPPVLITKSRWPRDYQAAWTVRDDADAGSLQAKRAVYYGTNDTTSPTYGTKGFAGRNLKITVTTFWQTGPSGVFNDFNHRAILTDLVSRGFETGLHTATSNADQRGVTANAIQAFSTLYSSYTWLEHAPFDCMPSAPAANLEDSICYGQIQSDPSWYIMDLLESSGIKYYCQASNNGLFGGKNGLFAAP